MRLIPHLVASELFDAIEAIELVSAAPEHSEVSSKPALKRKRDQSPSLQPLKWARVTKAALSAVWACCPP